MGPNTIECGWARALLSGLVLLCVLSAATTAAIHFHLDGQTAGDAHCSFCILHHSLIAVVAGLALCLSWRLLRFSKERDAEIPGFVEFRTAWTRPPPPAYLFP